MTPAPTLAPTESDEGIPIVVTGRGGVGTITLAAAVPALATTVAQMRTEVRT